MKKFRITSIPQNKKLDTYQKGGVYTLDGYKYKKGDNGKWTYESGQPIDDSYLVAKLDQQAKPSGTPAITLAPKPKPTITQKKTEYANLVNSPLIANQEKAQKLGKEIGKELKEKDLYEPSKNQVSFKGDPVEDFINKNILDDAMGKAIMSAQAAVPTNEDEVDNFRHPQAGRYAAEAIMDYFPEWAQYTGIPQAAGFLGANAMGVGHELGTIFGDPRWFDDTYKNNSAPGFLEKAKTILTESGEDIFNNAIGAGVGILPMSSRDKTDALLELSTKNMLPDGMVAPKTNRPGFSNNMYFKKGPNDPGKFKSPYKQELGGPLNTFAEGGEQGCPSGQYWDGTKCTKLITLKNDKKYIDGVANWQMHVSDPNKITSAYNDSIKDRLYSGKWGLDPESGALVKLSAVQPKSVTTLDAKTKASREKEKLTEKNYKAEEENKKAYEQSIIDAGFDPATFGKAKGVNTITGEPIYASSKEEAERINQEAINQAAIEGHAAVVNNPVFKTVANFTPVGMAVGAIEGLARFIPDAYTLAQNPSWAAAGQLGMDALQAAPVIGKPLATATGKAFDYVKNMEPVAPGPMMLLGRTGSTNMVKKNMNYYKQLLDSYDSKKMSASNRKFYNDLIETGKKQDGMLTEAQLRELDRLKNSNFDFGKRGYSLNFEEILKLPDEDILSKTGKSKEDWELFIEAKPDKYGKALEDTYNSAYNPTQEQLANIEAGKQQLLDFYSSGEYNRRLQNALPGLSFMDAHNYQNSLINAVNKTKPRYVKSKNSGTLESDAMAYSAGADASGTKLGIDFSSTGLSRPDSKYLVSHEYGHTSLYDDKNRKLLENLPKLSLDEETLKNWTKWGKESGNKVYDDLISYYSSPDETRQRGISAILYSKEAGISIDDLVDMPYNQVIELNRAGKIPKDIAELRQMYDQKELKDYLKKLYSIGIPTTGLVGTATMLANPFQGSDGLQQQKKGGITDDYIEMDIPKSKVQWYIDNGYEVEVLE